MYKIVQGTLASSVADDGAKKFTLTVAVPDVSLGVAQA